MITTEKVVTPEQLREAFRVRMEVFVEEQGVSAEAEIDEYEESSIHVLARNNGQPAGAGRLRVVEETAKLERICVLNHFRIGGTGKAIMIKLEEIAKEMGLKKAKLHAQTQAAGFYEKLGYASDSDVFMEEGIPHVRMIKALN
ncbi:GNAT family N-acetyltransferase [Paenibacillus sp. CAU 1782]